MMAMLRSRGRGLRRREIVWYEIKDGVIRPLMRVWRRMSLNIGTLATLSRRGLSREQVSRRTYRTDSKTRLCGRRETADAALVLTVLDIGGARHRVEGGLIVHP